MSSPIRVLHVDDEPEFASLAATFLERENERFEVETETNARDGHRRVRGGDIDCIVSDHDMPGMNGIEFLEAVRKCDTEIPFILFTGKGSEEVASKAVSAAATDYLQKGGGTEQYTLLAHRVENAVEGYRSRQAARTRERRLETLVSNLPGIVYRCENEPGWPMEYVAGECEPLVGYSSEALETGTVVWGEDVIHPDDRERIWAEVQAALDAGRPFECTYRVLTADDETRWMWERGRSVRTDAGDVEALEGFIADITESERQKQALQEYERRFKAVFDDPNLLVGLLEPDGTVRDVNRTALANTDADRSEIIGQPFPETPWWSDETKADVERWIADAASGEYVEYEATHSTGNGNEIEVTGSFRPVTDDNGDVTTIVVSATDITERKERKRELKRQNEHLDEFASFVSHDFQSPISTVKGRLQLALETGDLSHVERAMAAIERVDDLRADLVDTLQSGEIVSEREQIELNGVVEEVVATIDPPEAASVSVEGTPSIEADRQALTRMLENLIGNSTEHAGDDVTVRIGEFEDGLYYEDDGPGIDPEHREEVFRPGFSTKEGSGGIGMGMASVRQIVAGHDWEIQVTDAASLDGVRFEIGTT